MASTDFGNISNISVVSDSNEIRDDSENDKAFEISSEYVVHDNQQQNQDSLIDQMKNAQIDLQFAMQNLMSAKIRRQAAESMILQNSLALQNILTWQQSLKLKAEEEEMFFQQEFTEMQNKALELAQRMGFTLSMTS